MENPSSFLSRHTRHKGKKELALARKTLDGSLLLRRRRRQRLRLRLPLAAGWLLRRDCGARLRLDCIGPLAVTTRLDKQLDTHNGQHVHGTSVGAGRVREVRLRTFGSARFDAVGLNVRRHTFTS